MCAVETDEFFQKRKAVPLIWKINDALGTINDATDAQIFHKVDDLTVNPPFFVGHEIENILETAKVCEFFLQKLVQCHFRCFLKNCGLDATNLWNVTINDLFHSFEMVFLDHLLTVKVKDISLLQPQCFVQKKQNIQDIPWF